MKKPCYLCKNKTLEIDPTDTTSFSRYLSNFGTIEGRTKTRLCQKHQKKVVKAIKQARQLGLVVKEEGEQN